MIAAQAHVHQRDKGGVPYILHPIKVMQKLHTNDYQKQAIAVMHDVVEDGGITYHQLRMMGFSTRVIEGTRAMTKVPGQTQEEYELQVLANEDAIDIKMEDLDHNSRMMRLKGLREKDFSRVIKYQKFYARLKEAKEARARGIAEVYALVPAGKAVRGAEWREV